MAMGWITAIAGSLIAVVVAVIGSVLAFAYNKRILQDIGISHLPRETRKKYALIAYGCPYVRTWTHLDTFNLTVFSFGALLVVTGLIFEFASDGKKGTTDGCSFTLPFFLLAFILMTNAVILMINRMVQLINVYKYEKAYSDPAALISEVKAANEEKTVPSRQFVITVCIVAFAFPLTGVFVMRYWGVWAFIVEAIAYALFVTLSAIKENKKRAS